MERKFETLAETVDMMNSSDWKERFIAEYYQVQIRIDALAKMVDKYQHGKLDFTPNCPVNVLTLQLNYMQSYANVLKNRAEIEGIELFN